MVIKTERKAMKIFFFNLEKLKTLTPSICFLSFKKIKIEAKKYEIKKLEVKNNNFSKLSKLKLNILFPKTKMLKIIKAKKLAQKTSFVFPIE